MGRTLQWTQVAANTRTEQGDGTIGPDRIVSGWPVGDLLYHALALRSRVAITTAAANWVTRGRLEFIRSLRFRTEKHGEIYDGIDGMMLQQMSWAWNPVGPGNISPVGADDADDQSHFLLPLADRWAARPEDTALDMLNARPELIVEYGVGDDIEPASTDTDNLDLDVHALIDPGRIADPAKDGPIFVPHWGVHKEPISSTTGSYRISLPFGDRIYKRIYITQRNGSTLAELNNTVTGAAEADQLSLKLNGYPIVDRMRYRTLQRINDTDYQGFDPARGVAILDFVRYKELGGKLSEALSTISRGQGRLDLEIDVTSVSNGQLWIGLESVKPIPEAAQRVAPEPAKA